MKKILIPILLALLTGFFMGKFLFNQYDFTSLEPAFLEKNKITFLEVGFYSTEEEMKKNTTKFTSYIYENINNKYYVYIGITKKEENIQKIKEFWKKKRIYY